MKNPPRTATTWATMTLAAITLLILTPAAVADGEDKKCAGEASECVEMMTQNLQKRGWVGINYEPKEGGGAVVLTAVVPGSPAETAGLQAGDELTAVNGITYTRENEKKLKKLHSAFSPGQQLTLDLVRDGQARTVEVELIGLPQHIMAQWIGYHMLEGHAIAYEDHLEETGSDEPADDKE